MADYKVIILLGQSNQSGEAAISEYSTTQKEIKSKVQIWYNGVLEYFHAGANNRRRAVSEQKGGLEIELATQIEANYSGNVIFLKHEEGGTDVWINWVPADTDWKNKQYAQFKARLDAFEAYMAHTNPTDTYSYVACVWNQGEADGLNATKAAAYEAKCSAVFAQVRTDTSEAALPIYDFYLSDQLGGTPYKSDINTAKTALQVTYSTNIYDTDASDGYSFQDTFHYDMDSYTLAGSNLYTDLITNGDL